MLEAARIKNHFHTTALHVLRTWYAKLLFGFYARNFSHCTYKFIFSANFSSHVTLSFNKEYPWFFVQFFRSIFYSFHFIVYNWSFLRKNTVFSILFTLAFKIDDFWEEIPFFNSFHLSVHNWSFLRKNTVFSIFSCWLIFFLHFFCHRCFFLSNL